jgi:Flp pilus assembly protein TadG
MRRQNDERGAITALVAVVAIALVMVAGMAYDGGQVLAAHASARSLATKAARAGAQEIDLDALRLTGRPVLDPARAHAAAQDYLDDAHAHGTVVVQGDSVTVTVTIVQPMRILPLPDRIVSATDAATAVSGIEAVGADDA